MLWHSLSPGRAGDNAAGIYKVWCQPWEHLGSPATSLGALTRSLSVLPTSLVALSTFLGAAGNAGNKPGKIDIFFRYTTGARGNHSYYFSFNDF